jgi:hypothetical protein
MARVFGVSADALYFHANRQAPDVQTEVEIIEFDNSVVTAL